MDKASGTDSLMASPWQYTRKKSQGCVVFLAYVADL